MERGIRDGHHRQGAGGDDGLEFQHEPGAARGGARLAPLLDRLPQGGRQSLPDRGRALACVERATVAEVPVRACVVPILPFQDHLIGLGFRVSTPPL